MTQYTKPTVLPAWGESAGGTDVLQPTNAEIQAGWPLSNVPPSRKRFNWILKYLAQGVRYMMQMGIPVWDSTEDYPVNARVMGSDGKTYKAILTGINKDPTTQPTYWTRWGFTLAELGAEITTPPQFDNDTSLATTAFVQRALGNSAGSVSKTGSVSLTAGDVGKLITWDGNGTLTFPDASLFPAGTTFQVFKYRNPSGTIAAAVGTQLQMISVAVASYSVGPVMGHFRATNEASVKWDITGDLLLAAHPLFGASIANNGYQKLPSGLIIQWGSLSTSNTNGTVTFPTAFPNACFSVVAHDYALIVSDNSIVRFNLPTKTDVSWLGQSYTGSSTTPGSWTWIAIGY